MNNVVLQEFIGFNFEPIIVESKVEGKPSIIKLRGLFQEGDVKNGNNRIYPTRILTREVNKSNTMLSERRMIGELDHPPGEIKPRLGHASHVVTMLEMKGNKMYGELEIINTRAGQDLRALYEAGVKIGVSSRGTGGLKSLPNGLLEVDDTYTLNTFDVVNEPSVSQAYINESLNQNQLFIKDNVLNVLNKKLYFIF